MKRRSSSQTTGHLPEREGEGEREGIGFSTPELPTGQQLLLNLRTTWGDQFYIGLSGIEIFTASGDRACVEEVHTHTNKITIKQINNNQISADPPDINVLPEYSGDPRVVSNLLDGVNCTRDDLHMWLAPFTPSHPHTVTITFHTPTTLALVRIWVSHTTCRMEWRQRLLLLELQQV